MNVNRARFVGVEASAKAGASSAPPERVGGDDVEAPVAHDGRGVGHRVEETLHPWSHLSAGSGRRRRGVDALLAFRARSSRWARSASSSCKARATASRTAVGDTGEVSALEPGVVVDAHPGEHGDLFAAQAGNPTARAGLGSPTSCGVRRARRVARNSLNVVPVDHANHATSARRDGGRFCRYLEHRHLPASTPGGLGVGHDRQEDLVRHRRGPWHGCRHRYGSARRRPRRAATARNADAVTAALGTHDDLFAVQLDITDPASVDAAVAVRSTGSGGSTCW